MLPLAEQPRERRCTLSPEAGKVSRSGDPSRLGSARASESLHRSWTRGDAVDRARRAGADSRRGRAPVEASRSVQDASAELAARELLRTGRISRAALAARPSDRSPRTRSGCRRRRTSPRGRRWPFTAACRSRWPKRKTMVEQGYRVAFFAPSQRRARTPGRHPARIFGAVSARPRAE